jgi:hypothetical protein
MKRQREEAAQRLLGKEKSWGMRNMPRACQWQLMGERRYDRHLITSLSRSRITIQKIWSDVGTSFSM